MSDENPDPQLAAFEQIECKSYPRATIGRGDQAQGRSHNM